MAFVCAIAVVRGQLQGYSFLSLYPGYAQHLFGVSVSFLKTSTAKGILGGVVVLQNGDVLSAECETGITRLHRFRAAPPYDIDQDTTLHHETTYPGTAGGCGIAFHPDGFIYSNMNEGAPGFATGAGVARFSVASGASTKIVTAPPGNALGIAVDPVTNNIVYPGSGCKPSFGPPPCVLWELNPGTLAPVPLIIFTTADQVGYVDGVAFDPTGTFLFLTNRAPVSTRGLIVLTRTTPGGPAVIVQKVPMTTEPIGLGFHAASPKFVVTSNINGTLTRFDFAGDNYTAVPGQTVFASGGFRGDLMQAGPDGCLYVTQDGVRYDNGFVETKRSGSIVQVCGGFAPPPGIIPDPPPSPSSLCGYAYHDLDNNGIDDTTDPGISGVTVSISGSDYIGLPVSASTTTVSGGGYCFNNLQRGTYTISETQPSAYLDGIDTQGAPGTGTAGNDRFANIDLPAGYNGLNNNFGELLASSIGGYVYVDTDNSGTRGAGEAGIAGVAVTLTGTDDRGAAVTMGGATGTDGAYAFASLRPGTYTIAETQPGSYLDGKDSQGTPGTGITGNDVFSGVVLNQNVTGQNNNFGEIAPAPAVVLVKRTNGTDNDTGTGPVVAVGSVVTWTYTVSNTGNVPLSSVAVSDDRVGAVSCPAATVGVGESMTCSATGTAIGGQYTNIGTVTAQDAFGKSIAATNRDSYFGAMPGLSLTKRTNGSDNDTGTGPIVPAGSTVTWSYIVKNTGNVALSNIVVTDDKAGAINCPVTLAIGATFTCTKTGTAIAGQYTNIGTVTAKDPTGAAVTASNPDAYFGANPGVSIVKTTNGSDNDTGAGPMIGAGSPVTWTYLVANTGNVALSDVVVVDDKAGAVTCPSTVAAGASFTCAKTGTAVPGPYINVGTVTAKDPTGKSVTASNRDAYFGARPAISIVTRTNGTDNDAGPGPTLAAGASVTWTYIVSNAGNVALSNVLVLDDREGSISCPSVLPIGATFTCTKTGTVVVGPYTNVATVTATDPIAQKVSAQNADHYLGAVPPSADLGIAVSAPASATAGGALTYTLTGRNNGPSPAPNVTITHAIPAGMAFASVTASGWTCTSPARGAAGTVSCIRSSVATGQAVAIVVTVTVKCPFPFPGPVTIAATIGSSTADPNPLNNTNAVVTNIINPAPVITGARVNPGELWPPNHKMADVKVDYTVTPACGGTPTVGLAISSNQGDASDWQVLDLHHVRVRSERLGNADDRIYSITITATDPTGSSTQQTLQVTVPHDQGHRK